MIKERYQINRNERKVTLTYKHDGRTEKNQVIDR